MSNAIHLEYRRVRGYGVNKCYFVVSTHDRTFFRRLHR